MSGETLEAEGLVLEQFPGDTYSVNVSLGGQERRVLAKRSGRLNQARLRILPGDRVRLELSAYDLSRGRIVRRLDAKEQHP